MNLKPLGSRILIKAQAAEAKTESGIILPESAGEKPQKGEVLSIGSGKILDNGVRETLEVKVGDTVYYTKYGPTELKVDGEEVLIVDFNDILGVETN
jgi:chaperonin GroES